MRSAHVWRFKAIVGAGIVALTVVMTLGVVQLLTPPVWSPLGEYPVQEVHDRADGGNTPAVYITGDVHSTGTKCNKTASEVPIIGTQSWIAVIPPGTVIPIVKDARNVRAPGCSTRDYANPIPAEVQARTVALYAAGYKDVTWFVTGSDTPIRGGKLGHRVVWQTQSFRILLPPTEPATTDTPTSTTINP